MTSAHTTVASHRALNVRFPAPLGSGDLVGITSPSSGVPSTLQPRLDVAIAKVREAGFEVLMGNCMDGSRHVSASASERAAEFEAMLVDPEVRAIVPPWGGETAIDLLGLLDWDAISRATPKWVVGFSDIATLITPLTLVAGWATIHGQNLMDTPYRVPEGLLGWLDLVRLPTGSRFAQSSPAVHRKGFVDYAQHPTVDEYVLDVPGTWSRLDSPESGVDVQGRLIGGCIETLADLAGSPFLDTRVLKDAGDGLVVYLEAAEHGAGDICRHLHGMRLNGFFDDASAILIGRTYAPDLGTLTQHDAVIDALATLGVPIIADVECGHWAPYMSLVNGALCRVELSEKGARLTQTLA